MGNAPIYATIPEHNIQSPSTVVFYYCHYITFLPHAIFYPANPFINFYARSNCT